MEMQKKPHDNYNQIKKKEKKFFKNQLENYE